MLQGPASLRIREHMRLLQPRWVFRPEMLPAAAATFGVALRGMTSFDSWLGWADEYLLDESSSGSILSLIL